MSYHCLRQYKDTGFCKDLTGPVFWSFVFVDDAESRWSDRERKAQEQISLEVVQYVKKKAQEDCVELRLFMKCESLRISYKLGKNNCEKWLVDFAHAIHVSGLREKRTQLEKQRPGCKVLYVFLVNKSGRSYATPCVSAGDVGVPYCVIYKGGFYYILHETMHLFGAVDLYYPEQVKIAAKSILGESVMLLSDSLVIDELTRYLIGWHRTPTKRAKLLLDATAHVTKQMVESGLEAEQTNRNGIGRMVLENGANYEGQFKDGMPDGYGKYTYADGSVYEGQVKNGIPNGRGKYIYADGSIYEGQMKNGIPNGRGKIRFVNGILYEGELRDNQIQGRGCMTYADGRVQKGYFENGKYKGK